MTSGIPFGFGFGALPIPNADPNDPRRLVQQVPFDPAQPPGATAADLHGPMGALVHHPGWRATRTGAERGPALAMDEAETQRLEAQPGMVPGGAGVQVGQAGRYPGLAELFDRTPMGAPQAFEGTSGTVVPGQDAAPQMVPLPPRRPDDTSVAPGAPEAPPTRYTGLGLRGASTPAPAAMPAQGQPAAPAAASVRPFGALAVPPVQQAGPAAPQLPAPTQNPGQSAPSAAADDGNGFLSRLGDPKVYNTLLGIGQGLLTTKGLGPGIAAGTAYASKLNKEQAATDLAQAEYGLKQRKAGQETLGNNVTYQRLVQKGVDPADAQAAIAASMAGHSEALSNLLNNNFRKTPDAPAGFTYGLDGKTMARIPGGPQDPNVKREDAQASAEGTAAGTPEKDYNLGEGQTRFDGTTNKPILSTPAKKPESFDVETKLRTEFNKGLGSFQDVHDGYGRVIAATRERQDNPSGKSPAADISLIFGYMKMLDPGSVVREGEYATAGNAGGIDDRLRNTYNKLMNGESLSPAQRQDFIGQAGELYSTARKNAEAVAGRYRNLAGQYKVDPERSVYLPEVPNAPTVGPNKMRPTQEQGSSGQGVPSRTDLEAEARRRGLLR